MQFAFAYAPPLMIETAVHLNIFDQLDAGPQTVAGVAAASRASERGLRILMNGLVGIGLLARAPGDAYTLTPESEAFLVSTKRSFQGGLFRHMTNQLMPGWMHIGEVVRTGKPAKAVNEEEFGAKFFEQFVEALFPMNYHAASLLGDDLGLSDISTPYSVLDLAAGSGVWGIALAQKSAHISVTAVDWERVLPVTKRVAERAGVGTRFRYSAGDLATADFGHGHNAATLGHILHSEGEPRSRKLLKKVHDALAPGGTIAIAEFVCNDDRTGPPIALIFAINMLVNTDDGDTFTVPEIRSWLHDAGFEAVRTLDVHSHSPLILANRKG
jgi:3-hydroxy-5-methyl-1-naphthoate 3-O-methyltransferase